RSKPLPQSVPPRRNEPAAQPTPIQKPVAPRADLTASTGIQGPQPVRNRPAPPQSRPARPKSSPGIIPPRRAATTKRSRRPLRLLLALVAIIVLFVILFGVAYLNTASTVQIAVTTQNYSPTIKLTLSNKNQSGSVFAKSVTQTFTKNASEP